MTDERIEAIDRILAALQAADAKVMRTRWQMLRDFLAQLKAEENVGYVWRLMVLLSVIREQEIIHLTCREGKFKRSLGF